MRDQIEGSLAVAKSVALCRPEVISAYPISPQTHIVEALSDLVRTRELAPCEYLLVESEFAAMSAAIGASAAGARAYTATASQGLLYMAEALYNASGLGLPIVMTVANRAIGAPINIWNDHSDTMSQRDCGWIQLYAESNQEAVDLHVQAFKLAEELSLPVMVCMDGFVLTHAYEPVDVPEQDDGRRLPAALRASPGARPGRADHDRGDGRPGSVHRGPIPRARKADAGARPRPGDRRRVRADVRPRVRRPAPAVSDRGRGHDRRRARLRPRHDRGRRRRAARARSAGGCGRDQVLPAVSARRTSRRPRARVAGGRRRARVRRRHRRDRRPERQARPVGLADGRVRRRRGARWPSRSRSARSIPSSATSSGVSWSPIASSSSTSTEGSSSASSSA